MLGCGGESRAESSWGRASSLVSPQKEQSRDPTLRERKGTFAIECEWPSDLQGQKLQVHSVSKLAEKTMGPPTQSRARPFPSQSRAPKGEKASTSQRKKFLVKRTF